MSEEKEETKKCPNCKEDWEENHQCENSLQVKVSDTYKIKDLFG